MPALPLVLLTVAALQRTPPPAAHAPAQGKPPAAAPGHQDLSDDEEIKALFSLCDLDGNGWISLREAKAVLAMERTEFRQNDLDQDGRIDAQEFQRRSKRFADKLGMTPATSAPAPSPRPHEPGLTETPRPVFSPEAGPSPEQILELYDRDRSAGLDAPEIERILRHLGLDLSAESLMHPLDLDGSGALELAEVGPLGRILSKEAFSRRHALPARPTAGDRSLPLSFRRLDADGDAWIEADDLLHLLGGLEPPCRLSAILAALDRDGDGRLGPEELAAALRSR